MAKEHPPTNSTVVEQHDNVPTRPAGRRFTQQSARAPNASRQALAYARRRAASSTALPNLVHAANKYSLSQRKVAKFPSEEATYHPSNTDDISDKASLAGRLPMLPYSK